MVTDSNTIVEYFGGKKIKNSGKGMLSEANQVLNNIESKILDVLKDEPIRIGMLSDLTRISVDKLSSELTIMQLNGLVREEEGTFYAGEG